MRIVQRHAPAAIPNGATFVAADVEQAEDAASALGGVDAVVCAVGLPYDSAIWERTWPAIMRNLLAACATGGARFIFADNLYLFGPQTQPLREDTTPAPDGRKPRVRAEITRLWEQAHQDARVRATAVRAADFYGPDVSTSVISTYGVARLVAGQRAFSPYPPDNPHDFTYVPDFARALESLIDARDDAYGQAWHVPNAPTLSLRKILTRAAELMGVPPRISVLPSALMPVIGLLSSDVREVREMLFQWDRPYTVDASKFAARFWSDATPFDDGLRATIAYYKQKNA